MSPTSYQAALPRVIPSLLSATLIIIPYSNGFVKRVRKVFLQQKQRTKRRLLTFFPENQQPRQFTPLREGRQCYTPSHHQPFDFNSRPSARGNLTGAVIKRAILISIHAPPRGATRMATILVAHIAFQFTPLREGRPAQLSTARRTIHFNSRPSARGDARPPQKKERRTKFQFTPLREGRPDGQRSISAGRDISIHAPPRGAT